MLELKRLLTGETESVPFAVTLDMSGMTSDILSGKCSAAGASRGTPDHIVLTAALKCGFTAVCARCCKPFECSFEHSFEFPVAEKLESDEDEDKFQSAFAVLVPQRLQRALSRVRRRPEYRRMLLRRQKDRPAPGKA